MKIKLYDSKKLNWSLKPLATFLIAGLLVTQFVNAQTPTYSKGIGTGSNTIPMNTSGSHCQQIYLPTDFNTVPISGNITKIYFRNSVAGTSGTYTNFSVAFIQNSLTAFPNTTFLTGLTTALSSASITLTGNAVAGGWYEIPLTTPFPYNSSQTLVVEIKYTSKVGGMSNPTSSASGNKRLSIISAPGPLVGNLSTIWGDFGMDVAPGGACTDPPTAGTSTASPAGPFCVGTQTNLNLTGNSTGTGQTYQWFSDPSQFGSFTTSISGVLTTSSLNINPSATLWYRCAVTCGATTNFSAPVQVVINPPFPGGTYTIGPSGNYTSFTDAVNALNCGISGPVIFNVTPGTYTEQISIPVIGGSSSVNTVTFNGNGSTIQFTPVTANRHIIKFNGADYVTINNLNITGLAVDYDWGIHLTNASDNITINNCVIDILANTSTTQSNSAGIVSSNSTTSVTSTGNNASNLTVTGCTIKGGYQGIILNGLATSQNAINNAITNNIIQDTYANGIELVHNDGAQVNYNNISRPNRTIMLSATAGIEIGTGCKNLLINGNRIHDTHNNVVTQSGTSYGIFANGCDAPSGSENRITNNIIYNFNSGTGTQYGLYNSSSDGFFYYHNTVVLDNAGSTSGITRGFYQTTTASNIDLRNNIFSVTRGGTGTKHCIYFGTTTSTIISNYNVFYLNATGSTVGVGSFGTTNYSDLAAWMTANSNIYDQQSVETNPIFASPGTGDFTPASGAVNNAGTSVGVTTDILNQARSASTPDPGAYEFDLLGLDAAITWISPVNPTTAGLKTITINIHNTQAQTISALDLAYTDGGLPVTESFTGLSIAPGANQQLSFSTQYNLVTSKHMYAYISAVNGVMDVLQSNDTTDYILCIPLAGGTYTINSALATTGTNYQSFNDVSLALACGITGPVVFNVSAGSGPYNEQVTIPSITGSSAVNTVTFNGNGATIQYASSSTNERHVIKLDGADYIQFDNLIIGCSAGTYGWGIHLLNQANNNTISNCTINSNTVNSTTNSFACIVFSNSSSVFLTSGNNGNNNTISGNTLNGGYYTVVMYGNSTAGSENLNNTLSNNIITDSYSYTVYMLGQKNSIVSGNNFSRPIRNTSTTTAAVYLTTGCSNTLVEKNRVHNYFDAMTSSTSTCYTFYVAADGTASDPNRYINNLVYNMNGNGTLYGIYNTAGPYMKAYHNTIAHNYTGASAGTTYGFYQTGTATGLEYINNIVYITRGGTGEKIGLNFSATGSSITSNNNNIYLNSAGAGAQNIGAWGTTDYPTLASWQTVNGFDAASVNVNPFFVNAAAGNFKPQVIQADDLGAPLGILTDILNAARSSTNPDMGAYEYIGTVNAFCTGTPTPGTAIGSNNLCVNQSTTLSVSGYTSLLGITFQWKQSAISGGPYVNVTGGSGATTTSYLTPGLTSNTYYVCEVTCGGSGLSVLTNEVAITVTTPSILSSTPDTRCGYGTVNLAATSTSTQVAWYNQAIGGTLLHTGNTYSPTVSSTTTYYAAAREPLVQTPLSTGFTGNLLGTLAGHTVGGNMFDIVTTNQITINSFDIHLQNAALAPSNVTIYYKVGTYVGFTTNAGAWTLLGSATGVVSSGVGVPTPLPIPINMTIPAGQTYGFYFIVTNLDVANPLRYNTSATSPPVGSVAAADHNLQVLTGTAMFGPFTTAIASPIQRKWNGRINYTYNCEGPRLSIEATVTTAPTVSVTSTYPAICPGGNTDLFVSSVNDPDYTYAWSSNPAGFTANTAGPHNVSPTATTTYYLLATDNTTGPNQGCAALDSVTVINGGAITAGTISASETNFCASGNPILTATGTSGGFLQWQKSTVSSSGPWTNVGTSSPTYNAGVITQTTYYQLIVSCNTSSLPSNVVTVTVNNPQISGTTPDTRCGPGPVTLGATASIGTVNWYANATGGIPLATGNSYSTNVSSTTTYYAAAVAGGGTENVPSPNAGTSTFITATAGWGLRFTVNNACTISSVVIKASAAVAGPATIQIRVTDLSDVVLYTGTMHNFNLTTTLAEYTIPVNITIVPGNYKMGMTYSGISDMVRESSGVTFPYNSPSNAVSITAGANGAGSAQTTSAYYWFYHWTIATGCEGTRTAIVANVTTPPSLSVTPTQTICSNVSATLNVTSPNDPSYTYTWTPVNLNGSSITVNPATTTTYTVNAIDNTVGPNAGCTNIATVVVNVNPAPGVPVMTPASALLCEDDTVKLKAYSLVPHTGTLGTQAAQNTLTTYPAPYSANFGSQRTQMLVKATELIAAGYTAGSEFSGIQFPVVSFGANWGSTITSLNSFQVSIGITSLTSISAFQTGLTQVVTPANFTPVAGYNNTHTFNAPFVWNGTSNIIIETTFGNNFAGVSADGVIQYNTTTSYQSTIMYRADNVTAAAAAIATTVTASYSSRADFKLVGKLPTSTTWSPLTDLFVDENLTTPYTGGLADSVYSNPSVTRTYTSNAALGSCTSSNTVTVTVDVIPQVNITAAGPTSYCPGSTVTLNASTDPTYTNYAWTPAGPSGPGATTYTVGGSTNSTTVYTVTATGAGGCTSHQDIPVTVYDTVSPVITVIGNPNLCTGQTTSDLQGDIFGATGPAQSYAWSTSETTQLITVSTGGTYSLVTTDVHGCLTHSAQVISESIAPTAPIVTPAGPINLCSFDGGNTYNAATLTVTNYSSDLQWSTSETTTSIIVDYPDNFFAIYTDPSGCYSVSNTVTTSTYLASDAATGATSDASFNAICLGNTVTLTVDGGFLGDGADWHWYEGSCTGGTPRGTGSSITLTPATSGLHTYYVRAEGICNTTTCASISILVSTAPPPWGASITTYPVAGCNGTTAVMSGPVVSGASFYNWSCAQGGVLFNGSPGPIQTATPTVTVTFVSPPPAGASGYSICVFAGNGCGQSLTFCRFVRARVSQPSAISGSIIACANTNSIYSVGAVAGADTYTWTVTGNATINGGTNTITTASNSVTVNFLAGWSTGTLSVYSSLSCGFNSAARSLAISSTPAVPGVMGGPGYVCPGSSASFNVPAVNGAASYNWTTSVPGAVISPSSNSASILFPAVIPAGSTVCVTAVSSCGNASAARCKSIANGIPNIPGNISGPVSGQCAQSGVSYSVIPVAQATAYLWTATGGASVSGPNNLSAVSINFPSGFVTCTLSVVAQNSCGSSTARTLIVNGAPAQPGTITGSQSVCNGAVEPYSTSGSTGATSYGWAVPAGATILNTPPYGSSILVMWGATGGNVTVNATNDCGSSTMRTLSVAVTCREAQISEALKSTATLYPNPTGGKTTLQFDSKANVKYALQVLDVTGRMILSENISAVEGSNMHELDFTTIAKGMYLIRLESSDAEVQLLKLTVE